MWQLPHEMDDYEFKENYYIDHCRAIATFDLSDPGNQFKELAEYTASIKKKKFK